MAEEQTNPQANAEENNEEAQTRMEAFLHHQRRALEETGKALEALLPDGFRQHGSQASKEFTKGFRVLVDAALEEMKKARTRSGDESGEAAAGGDDDRPSTTGKAKVKVEVE